MALPEGFGTARQALLSDPQTSGGLLVSCAPESADAVLAVFQRHGFESATVIGSVQAAGPLDSSPKMVVTVR